MKLRIHLFEWPSRHNVHLALPLMLVLSFALHAASMFLFHTSLPAFERQRGANCYHHLYLTRLAGSSQAGPDSCRFGSGTILLRECRTERLEPAQDSLRGEL